MVVRDGISLLTLERFGTQCFALVCDPSKVTFAVTDHFNILGEAVNESGAFAGINGDGWCSRVNEGIPCSLPNSVAWSNGKAVQVNQYETRPFFNVTISGFPSISHQKSGTMFYNTVSADRYLIKDGEINKALYSRPKEKNARTAVGITTNGHVVLFKCDGWDVNNVTKEPPKGLDWIELATVGIELGCADFINLDGGGSSTMWLDGKEVGVANDDGRIGYRSTVNHLLVFISDYQPPMTGDNMKYEIIKVVRKRLGPSFYEKGNGDASLGTFESNVYTDTTEDIPRGGTVYTVRWVQLPDGNWIPKNHYSNGDVYLKEIEDNEDPNLVLDIKYYSDGKLVINGSEVQYTPLQ